MADVCTTSPPIGGSNLQTSPDLAIAALADAQHGVVALRQLIELGLSRKAVEHRLRAGRLHAIYPGVYAVGHTKLTRHGLLMAAVLWAGEPLDPSRRQLVQPDAFLERSLDPVLALDLSGRQQAQRTDRQKQRPQRSETTPHSPH